MKPWQQHVSFTFAGLCILGLVVFLVRAEWLPGDPVPAQTPTRNVLVIEVDDCQYVVYRVYNEGSITHKGNCSNPIHGGKNAEAQ